MFSAVVFVAFLSTKCKIFKVFLEFTFQCTVDLLFYYVSYQIKTLVLGHLLYSDVLHSVVNYVMMLCLQSVNYIA
jgi:hypothetical protein